MLRFLFFIYILAIVFPVQAQGLAPAGTFTQTKCVSCHTENNPEVVTAWRASFHDVDCIDCHGDRHGGSAAHARKNSVCTVCHGGPEGAAAQSYRLSKHGVIAGLEEKRWDWSQTLADGNYRAPTCSYCHMHGGDHGLVGSKPASENIEETTERRSTPCLDCHSPRFVATWFKSGEAMVELGRMKSREAERVVEEIVQAGDISMNRRAWGLMAVMTGKHLRNVRLGVFHQSPDHQWWHGHPALDGDLLRIKGLLGDMRRRRKIGK